MPPKPSDPLQPAPAKRRGRPPSGQREAILRATLELLPELGIAHLTTRAVAARAGVSEASVYYHFTDRAGLLRAGFELGLQPLAYFGELPEGGTDVGEVFAHAAQALEAFLHQTLPVLVAAQADPDLHAALAAHMLEQDLGPHRGVRALAAYLAREQAAGRVRAGIDTEAVALMLIGGCFTGAFQRLMVGGSPALPASDRLAGTLAALVEPATAPRAPG